MKKNWFKLLSGLAILPIVTTIPLVVTSCSDKNDKNIEQPGESIIPDGGNGGQTGGGNGGQAGGGQQGGNSIIDINNSKEPPIYKPSTETGKLISKDSLNKIYESTCKRYEKWINELIMVEGQYFDTMYEKFGISSMKCEVNQNILSFEIHMLEIPKIPINEKEMDTGDFQIPIPDGMKYQDVKSYERDEKTIYKIDLVNKTYDETRESIAKINGKDYKNLGVPAHNNEHKQFELPINVCIKFLEAYGMVDNPIYYSTVNVANLPPEQANKIYDIICNLVKIIPPQDIDETKNIECKLSSVDISLGEENKKDSIAFSYGITSTKSFNHINIRYSFNKIDTNNWDLEYVKEYPPSTTTINGITDQQVTNFFKEILTNFKIIDVNQIKK